MRRSFGKFEAALAASGLREETEALAWKHRVSLEELYNGDRAPSIVAARKVVYKWLMKNGKSLNEVARIFDRAPSGVWKLTGGKSS